MITQTLALHAQRSALSAFRPAPRALRFALRPPHPIIPPMHIQPTASPTANRRQFLKTGSLALTASLLTHTRILAQRREQAPIGLATTAKYPETTATLQVRNPQNIRLLQFTDLHFFCNREKYGPDRDAKTEEDTRRLIELYQPDLIAITGDLWHDNPDGQGEAFMTHALKHVESLGVPWLFTWGNHDQLNDYTPGHHALTTARNSLYRGGPQGGNYRVRLQDNQGNPLWDLLCLNTTNLGLQKQQRYWLDSIHQVYAQQTAPPPPAFALFHIPLLQYDYIWTEEMASGFKRENVCSDGENGTGLSHLQQLGNVRAMFCGHDHVNDYSGKLDGIELAYGRATGHAGYGGDTVRKGAKLITINAETKSYAWESVFIDNQRWHPKAGFRTTDVIDAYWMRHG